MNATLRPMTLFALALAPGLAGAPTALAAPEAAVAGIRAAAPSIAVDPARIEREARGNEEAFEFAWEADGGKHEVVVTADGQLLVEEHEIDPAELPARILEALRKQGLTAVGAERVRVEAFEVEVAERGEAMERKSERDDDDEERAEDEPERFFLPDGVPVSEAWLRGQGGDDEDRCDAEREDEDEQEEGQEIKPGRLPAAVQATLKRVLPGFKIEEAEEGGSGREAVYIVEGEADEHDYEVTLDARGGLLSLEREDEEDDDD